MKILHVTKKYPNALGGDAVVVSNLEKQQRLSGHEVTILTSNCDEIQDGKNVYKFGLKDTPAVLDTITVKRLLSLIMLFFKAYPILRRERPDIIHTHSIDMAFFISFAARHNHIPIVHTFHIVTFNDPRLQGIRSKVELKFLRGTRPAMIFVLNPADISGFKAVGFENVKFVPNGVTIDEWQPTTKLKKNPLFTFIGVGRLEEQKGFNYFIEAAAKLRESGLDFQVQIVGEGADKPALTTLIREFDLAKQVYLVGRKSPAELKILYAQADVFVLSSLWEGMPLTLLEAWAADLPAIATEVSCVPYIAKDVALLIPAADSEALAKAMKKMLTVKAYRDKLSTKSAQLVAAKYQWSHIAKNLYDEVLRSHK